jgi:hypothetical protein
MISYPWYPALEVGRCSVIDIRLRKRATVAVNPAGEAAPMAREKLEAALESGSMLAKGRSRAEMIDFYRVQVVANAQRLATLSG